MDVVYVCPPAHRGLAETLVEADQSAENLLAVGVQLLKLILYQCCILRWALLDQTFSKHYQPVNALGVQGDLLLETLQEEGWMVGWLSQENERDVSENQKEPNKTADSICKRAS